VTADLDKRLDKSLDRFIFGHGVDWNPAKCSKNIADRGIDFADVLVGFIDPARKVVRDDRKNYGEVRYNMLAKVNGRVFHVTFTERGRILWIISARKANQREQRRYDQG
jgi:uncharacterized protein